MFQNMLLKHQFFLINGLFFKYAQAGYKLQMHRFSTKIKKDYSESDWILIGISGYKRSNDIFDEMQQYLDRYIDDYGFGG